MTHDTITLVTGANKGIGKETARQLAALGHTVLVGARDPERGRAAVADIAAGGARVRYLPLDVTDAASVAAAAASVDDEYGRLDVLVNNAGIARGWGQPSQTTMDDVRATYEVNVFGLIAVTNAMLPLLRRSAAPRIVNLSSALASLSGLGDPDVAGAAPALLAYSPSKTAVNGVTVAFASELRDTAFKVNAVNPGYCATDLNGYAGELSPAVGAQVCVLAATLPEDGPSGAFLTAGGTLPW